MNGLGKGNKALAIVVSALLASTLIMVMFTASPGATRTAITDQRALGEGVSLINVTSPFIVNSTHVGSGFFPIVVNSSNPGSHLVANHAPIHIEGDAQFLSQAENESWAGTGTAADPFIITGYTLVLNEFQMGIHIANTTYHFEIKNVIIASALADAPGARGIWLEGVDSPLLSNVAIRATGSGIILVDSSAVTVMDSTLTDCLYNGIWSVDVAGITVKNCHISGTSFGIMSEGSSNMLLESNHFTDMEFMSLLDNDAIPGLVVWNNTCINASLMLSTNEGTLDGIVIGGNTVNGKPFLYLHDVDLHGANITAEAGQIVLYNVTNGIVNGRTFASQAYGIELVKCSHISVTNNTVNTQKLTITVAKSNNITVTNNTAKNARYGAGLYLYESDHCTLTSNDYEVMMAGIMLQASSYNSLSQNRIGGCDVGMEIDQNSDHNTIAWNTIARSNGQDLNVTGTGNSIYLNKIIFNEELIVNGTATNVYDGGSANAWYASVGGRTVGNYWSAYTGEAVDGIISVPLKISGSAGSDDKAPLAEPVKSVQAPTGLKVTWTGQTPTLRWNRSQPDNASLVGYYLIYRAQGNGTPVLVSILPYTASSFKDDRLDPGVNYTYWVSVKGVDGSSATSDALGTTHGSKPIMSTELAMALVFAVVLIGMGACYYIAREEWKRLDKK